MGGIPGASRLRLPWLALLPLLVGCPSTPAREVSISPSSSLLAVDVQFPFPLSRDPSLVQVFFVKGPIHRGLAELPEFVPASFVKRSRAYLLDPEPGTYSVVAVNAAVAPPWNEDPVAGGVTHTVWSGVASHALILSSELIQRTRTTVGAGSVAFMGALRVRRGMRINESSVFRDTLEKRIAERLRPGVTSESGLSGWFTMTWTVDPEETSFSDGPKDRESFLAAAQADLGVSPWAQVVARAASREAAAATPRTTAPRSERASTTPGPATPQPATPEPRAATGAEAPREPATTPGADGRAPTAARSPSHAPGATAAARHPDASVPTAAIPQRGAATREEPPAEPRRRPVPDLPPDSPLARVELGMSHDEVRRILGDPDHTSGRLTSRAWIPFYTGPDAQLVDWIYRGKGRVVFSLHDGTLEVLDVVDERDEGE